MYGLTPIATIENARQPAAGEQVEQLQERLRLDQVSDRGLVDRWDGNDCQRPIDDQHRQHEEDAPADVWCAEGVDQGLEHV